MAQENRKGFEPISLRATTEQRRGKTLDSQRKLGDTLTHLATTVDPTLLSSEQLEYLSTSLGREATSAYDRRGVPSASEINEFYNYEKPKK
ncbi:MAG: hypothetical protein M3P33_00610 [bacterium]|nr:hypothetical protein [bacterium]